MVIRIFIYGSRLKHTFEVKVLNVPNTQGTAPAVVVSFTSEVLIKVCDEVGFRYKGPIDGVHVINNNSIYLKVFHLFVFIYCLKNTSHKNIL